MDRKFTEFQFQSGDLAYFESLSPAMKSKYLTDMIRYMEQHWGGISEALVGHFKQCLEHARVALPLFLSLKISVESLSAEMSLTEFLCQVLPVERLGSWPLREEDYLITHKDKSEHGVTAQTVPMFLIADNIRSVFNIGSFFRSSECLGVRHIYLCGFSATPQQTKVSKSAMGTESLVSWSQHQDSEELIGRLKKEGVRVLGFETVRQSQSLYDFNPRLGEPVAILVGNERHGLDQKVLKLCDEVIHIPVYGRKNSLNVASAFSIAAAVIGQKIRALNP